MVTPLEIALIDLIHDGQITDQWRQTEAKLERQFARGKLVLLAGSGISQFAPSTVPVARDIARKLRQMLYENLPASLRKRRVFTGLAEIPFEVLMARLAELNLSKAREVAHILTKAEFSNPIHQQIALIIRRAAAAKQRVAVITSNYDTGISLALAENSWLPTHPRPYHVVREEDIQREESHEEPRQEIFYIHGITDDPSTLVLDYKDEYKLAHWKKQHLATLLDGATLLIVGFSGWDIDISEAIAGTKIDSVVWVQENRANCRLADWSSGAQAIVQRARDASALNTDGDLRYVLSGLAGMQRELSINTSHLEERYRLVEELLTRPREPWLPLWARWTALRAGYAEMGVVVPLEEQKLIPQSMLLDMRAHHHFYAGRHRTAARLQEAAASSSLQIGEPLERYVFYRNNAAEFWNRGAYSVNTLRCVGQTLFVIVIALITRHRHWDSRAEFNHELVNLMASLVMLWPFLPLYLLIRPFLGVLRALLSFIAGILLGRDIDKQLIVGLASVKPESATFLKLDAQYQWLGQPARRINSSRIIASWQLRRFVQSHDYLVLRQGYELASFSASWAIRVGDPCRCGKSCLLALEYTRLLGGNSRVSNTVLKRDHYGRLALRHTLPRLEKDAWEKIASAETWRPYFLLARFLYKCGTHSKGRATLTLRLAALALLETT